VLDAAPLGMVPDSLSRQILTSIGARAVAIKMGSNAASGQRRFAAGDRPRYRHADRDEVVRDRRFVRAMLATGNHTIRVIGPTPGEGQFIEVVVDEAPLRQAMYRFSRNLLLVSLGDRGP